jgi:hypothetical protein
VWRKLSVHYYLWAWNLFKVFEHECSDAWRSAPRKILIKMCCGFNGRKKKNMW